jgi:signal recognition particle subunit SRP54
MFEGLSERLSDILSGLTRRGALTEEDVSAAMREVRRALLEADVALEVVRSFTDKVRARAVGAEVVKSVTPGQQVVKIVHDQLVEMLGADAETIDLNAAPPVRVLMVGLQGSGKTTTTAKIAKRLTERRGGACSWPPSTPAARPRRSSSRCSAARSASTRCRSCRAVGRADRPPGHGGGAPRRLRRGHARYRRPGHGDEGLMAEAAEVKAATNPHEVLLVADALTGQDASPPPAPSTGGSGFRASC